VVIFLLFENRENDKKLKLWITIDFESFLGYP